MRITFGDAFTHSHIPIHTSSSIHHHLHSRFTASFHTVATLSFSSLPSFPSSPSSPSLPSSGLSQTRQKSQTQTHLFPSITSTSRVNRSSRGAGTARIPPRHTSQLSRTLHDARSLTDITSHETISSVKWCGWMRVGARQKHSSTFEYLDHRLVENTSGTAPVRLMGMQASSSTRDNTYTQLHCKFGDPRRQGWSTSSRTDTVRSRTDRRSLNQAHHIARY